MRDYLCLTKTLLKTFFRPNKQQGKERTVSYIILIVLGAIFAAAIAVMFGLMGAYIKSIGMVAEMTSLVFMMGFVMVLVFGTIGIFSYVYFAKDSEFLFSLPMRNSTVYIAKLTVVYFQELLISTLLMLPGLIALAISTGQGFVYYLMILLAVALVPVCPLFVSSLVAIPMMVVASYFKNKGAVSAVLLILLFAVIMGVYMYFVMAMQTGAVEGGASLEEMTEAMKASLSGAARVLYPLFCLARFGTLTAGFVANIGASAVIDLAVFLGTVAVGAAVTIAVSGAVYGRSVLKQNEHARSSAVDKREYVQGSALKALVKKEWRELVRNTSFAFQCLAGVIIAPLFAVIIMITMTGQDTGTGMDFVIAWFVGQLMVQMMGAGMNQAATTAVTREGASFAYSKSMPVPYATQMLAKVILSDAIAAVTIVLSVIAMAVTAGVRFGYVDVLSLVLSLIFLLLYATTYTNFCVIRDAKKPKLDWVTPREAIKGNVTIMVPMFIGFGISIVSGIGLIFFVALFTSLDMQILGIVLGMSLLIIVSAVLLIFSSYRIKNNADEFYAKLTV